jgi:hypothetical protein
MELAIRRVAKKLGGGDCHAIEGAWILRVNGTADDVYKSLADSPLMSVEQPILVCELKGKWRSRNAATGDDCFRL